MAAKDFDEEDITQALMAVVAWAGNITAAHRDLKGRGSDVSYDQLRRWTQDVHREKYEQLREKYADQMEKQMAHEFRDVAAQAVQLQKLALDKAEARVRRGDDNDPAKTAMMASRVSHTAVDKLMTLTNRPTKISETRDVSEITRSLVAMGVLTPLPAGSQVHEAEADVDAELGRAHEAD